MIFRNLERGVAALATATGLLGELAILAMLAHMSLDMILRVLTGTSPEGMPEAVERIYMVMAVFLPLSAVQMQDKQIEVSVLTGHFPDAWRSFLRVLTRLVTALMAGLLTWLAFPVALTATMRGERVVLTHFSLPVWPARWAVVLGFGLLCLVALVQLISVLRRESGVEDHRHAS